MQRSSEKRNVSANRLSAGKSAYRLIYNRLKHGSRNIAPLRALVKQRLNIALCEYSAARRYRVNRRVLLRQLVQAADIRVQKRRHLVDKRARSSRARSVHSLFKSAREICNLRILAAKLNCNIGLRYKRLNSVRSCRNLLHKRYSEPLRYRNPSRARNRY